MKTNRSSHKIKSNGGLIFIAPDFLDFAGVPGRVMRLQKSQEAYAQGDPATSGGSGSGFADLWPLASCLCGDDVTQAGRSMPHIRGCSGVLSCTHESTPSCHCSSSPVRRRRFLYWRAGHRRRRPRPGPVDLPDCIYYGRIQLESLVALCARTSNIQHPTPNVEVGLRRGGRADPVLTAAAQVFSSPLVPISAH